MALRARCIDVCAGEREIGQIMIVLRRRPSSGSVAFRAVVRIVARFMVRIIRHGVIRLVTRPAIGRRSRELSIHMTLSATRADVRARQRKSRIVVIE